MNRESFLETIKQQYSDEIHEAYLECEHEGKIDMPALTAKLKKLISCAQVEGLSESEFLAVAKTALPDPEVLASISSKISKKAA